MPEQLTTPVLLEIQTSAPSAPSKSSGKTKYIFLGAIILLILFALGSGIYYQTVFKQKLALQKNNNTATATVKPSIPTTKNVTLVKHSQESLKNKILYAKKTSDIEVASRSYPVYSIYTSNNDGANKNLLLTIGNYGDFVNDFYLIKDKGILIVNYEYKLVEYDLFKGLSKNLFLGQSNKNYIFGFAVSPDNKKIALNVSVGAYFHSSDGDNETSFRIINVDLDSNAQTTILSKTTQEVGGFWLTPVYWSSDNKNIYMREAIPVEHTGNLWSINQDGANLKKLSVFYSGDKSPDTSYFAFLVRMGNNTKFGCVGYPMDTLKIFNFKNEQEIIVETNDQKEYSIDGWSADSKQLLYTTSLYKSGEGCLAEMYPEKTFIYDLNDKQIQQITSKKDKLLEWYPVKPTIEIKDNKTTNKTEFYYNNNLIDTSEGIYGNGKIEYIGTFDSIK